MSRHELSDLVAGSDIADLAGVGKAAVSNWRVRHSDFPQPVVTVGRGLLPIFSRTEVVIWLIKHNRITFKNGEIIS